MEAPRCALDQGRPHDTRRVARSSHLKGGGKFGRRLSLGGERGRHIRLLGSLQELVVGPETIQCTIYRSDRQGNVLLHRGLGRSRPRPEDAQRARSGDVSLGRLLSIFRRRWRGSRGAHREYE